MLASTLTLIFFGGALARTIPDYIHICHRNDPKLAECITQSIYDLMPRLRGGIPELKVPVLEPLHIRNLHTSAGTHAAHVTTNLTDILTWKGSFFEIQELIPKVEQPWYRFKIRIPELQVTGNYGIDSKILLLHMQGQGKFELNMTNCDCVCTLSGRRIKNEDGFEHVLFEKMELDIGFSKGTIHLDNLFNGDPVLGNVTNNVLNDNMDIFFKEAKPRFEDTIAKTFLQTANAISAQFNFEEMFPL